MLGNTPIPLILPVNKLSFKSNCVNDDRLSNSLVIVPVNSLKSKSKKIKFVNRPISVGMVEDNLPRSIPQMVNMDSNPISVGMVPTRLFCSVTKKKHIKSLDGHGRPQLQDNHTAINHFDPTHQIRFRSHSH